MSVVWSILALIIAGVVCYFIYEEYIVDKPEESEAETAIEADLMAVASEAGMPEFGNMPDSRKSGTAPAIAVEGAAIIGKAAATGEHAPANAPAVDVTAVKVSEVDVTAVEVDDVVVADVVEVDSVAVADESVEDATATMNAVVVEAPADEDVVDDEDVAEAEADVVVAQRTAEVPPEVDDLSKIKGIGKVYAKRLTEAGITSYQQIVDTDVATLEKISQAIPAANAHDWARQARKLADG